MKTLEAPPGLAPAGNADACLTQLLTVDEVARSFRVCTKTVRNMIASKKLEAVKIGRQIRIPQRAALRCLVSGRTE